VDAHRVEVLDRAHDDDVVARVPHHLELELVPPADGLLDEDLPDRAFSQPDLRLLPELGAGLGEASAVAAERERRPDDRGQADPFQLGDVGDDPAVRHTQADALHRLAEEAPVLGAGDRLEAGADELDSELVEHALFGKAAREVERSLAAERR
jgi:hypothetical protein